MAKYYEQTRDEMLDFLPKVGMRKILDVGCGQGVFASTVKKRFGAEVWGIEPVKEQALKAKALLDRVLIGGFDDVRHELPARTFDCIIFNDVLEHIIDPENVLIKVKDYMSHEGVLVCSIPNVRYFPNLYELLVKKDWRYRDSGILDRTHLRFFTRKSMQRMFSACGYEHQTVSGINPLKSKKMLGMFYLANIATLGMFSDAKYQQYASVLRPHESK